MTDSGEEMVATMRVNSLWTRLGLAALAALTAYLLHPTFWPAAWLSVYTVTVVADRFLFRHALTFERSEQWRASEWQRIVSVIVTVVVFSSLSVYNWFLGGAEGRVFAAISVCCSLMSVTLTMYHKKRYLFAALVPHALYLISLPVVTVILSSGGAALPFAVVSISILAYLVYLMVAVRTLNGNMLALGQARQVAEAAMHAAEEANAAKSNFLAVITHEIRTPMNAVVSSVNLLRKTSLDDGQRAHLNLMAEANDVLLGLLNDVLDLSKIEAGKMTFEASAVYLPEMLRNLEALFLPQATEKGLTLKTILARDLDEQVISDPLRLRQILFNLVSNAVKFTSQGTIWLRVRRRKDGMLGFEIEDQGIGIDAEQLERIFSSFEQGEAATTRRYGGTGLGLAISRKLARLMGGDITVRSEPGLGSCFCLSLPYEPSTSVMSTPDVPAVAAARRPEPLIHVLIVDDHEVNRRIVSLFLEPMGWGWTMADNGIEAVERCYARRFDVILMDMQMPLLDGIAATRRIRAGKGPNRETPIIALTANSMDYHRAAWAEVGVEDFLTKPIDPELLITTLLDKAEGRAALPGDQAISV